MQSMAEIGLPELSVATWLLALLPIIVCLVLMMQFKMSGGRAGFIAWLVSLAVVSYAFGGGMDILASGTAKGLWTTIFVLYIVWSSMFLYNVVECTGSFKVIAATFTKLTNGNKLLQLLILGWAFPSFIQGVCGFGVPVAVAAPLLLGLGFNPILSVVTPLLGHSWGVSFGSLGSSFSVLLQLTPDTLDATKMAVVGALFIAFGGLIVGLCVCHAYGGMKGIVEGFPAVLVLMGIMAIAMVITCRFISPNVATFVAGALGTILGGLLLPKLPMYRPSPNAEPLPEDPEGTRFSFLTAFSAYIILICVVFAVYLIAPLKSFLETFKIGLAFPETVTAFGYVNEAAAKYSALKIFTAPGTLIVLSSILASLFYKMKGVLPAGAIGKCLANTAKQSIGATTTIMTMTMMAVMMTESGMTTYIAYGIAMSTGKLFAIFSPFISLIGGFVTSSGTSCHILFTSLQYQVADILKISPYIVLAMHTTGASLSNSFSPGNVALGTGVTGLSGREGECLKMTGVYCTLQCLLVGLLGWACIYLFHLN